MARRRRAVHGLESKVRQLGLEVHDLRAQLVNRLAQLETEAHQFLKSVPAGPWEEPARRLLRLVAAARTKAERGEDVPEVTEIRELNAKTWQLFLGPYVKHALRFRGSKPGRMDALSRTIADLLKQDRRRASKDVWLDLMELAKRGDTVIRKVERNAIVWKPAATQQNRTTTKKALFNRLSKLRRHFRS